MLARFVLLLFSFAWVPCVLVCMRPIRSIGCYLICWKWANCAIFLGAAFVAATADVSVHFFLLVDATRRTITHNPHISFLLFCSSVFVRHQKRRSEKNRNEYLIWSYLHSTAGWSSIACVTQKQKSFSRRTFHQTNFHRIFFCCWSKQLRSVCSGLGHFVTSRLATTVRSVLASGLNILSNVQSFDGLRRPWLGSFSAQIK